MISLIHLVHTISRYNLITDEAKIPKQLMIMSLAISETFFLVMAMTQEGFFAFGTYEMLHMPMLAKRRYHAFFDGTPTSATNRNSHFIMTPQTIQLVLRNMKFVKIELDCENVFVHIITNLKVENKYIIL